MAEKKACSALSVRGAGMIFVAELPEEVMRRASDPGESRYLELHEIFSGGESLWIRADQIVLVRSADVMAVPPAPGARPLS